MHPTEATPTTATLRLPAPIELQIENCDTQVNYLTESARHSTDPHFRFTHVTMGRGYRAEVGVTRFLNEQADGTASLCVNSGGFHLQISLTPAELRLLATALCAAADDAEAAQAASLQ